MREYPTPSRLRDHIAVDKKRPLASDGDGSKRRVAEPPQSARSGR